MSAQPYHTPVLLKETMEALAIKPDGTYLDGTLGGGGHFQAIVDRLEAPGHAIGIDRDPEAIRWSGANLRRGPAKITIAQSQYSKTRTVLDEAGVKGADGILLDLGVSSRQIDDQGRGFRYQSTSSLDMRMDPAQPMTAARLLAETGIEALTRILGDYGEIINPGRMAAAILSWRKNHELRTSDDLRACLSHEYGKELEPKVLAKVFQALRIAVNNELDELETFLASVHDCLNAGGRLVIVSYHSLEDRMVKTFLVKQENPCNCPPLSPTCVCGKQPLFKRINKKVIKPSDEEIAQNPRSRSARMRVAERC